MWVLGRRTYTHIDVHGSMALVKAWLKSAGYWIYASAQYTPQSPQIPQTQHHARDSQQKITHVFLDGGKASIPCDQLPELFEVCEKSIHAGDPPCLVERLAAGDGLFKMFVDVDMRSSTAGIRDIARCILDALPTDLDAGSIIICQRISSLRDNKQGLHIIWEDVVVSSQQAMSLLRTTTSNLTCLFPEVPIEWYSILDASVYRNNGLRTVYSRKGKDPADDSRYEPWLLSSSTEKRKDMEVISTTSDVKLWLKRCSIIPLDHTGRLISKSTSSKNSDKTSYKNSDKNSYKNSDKESTDDLFLDSTDDLTRAIDALLSRTAYKGCKWTWPPARLSDQIFVIRIESKYCHNIQREHQNNHVYLTVTRAGVFQACHCRCPHHTCSTYRKTLAGRGNAVSAILFQGEALKVIDTRPRGSAEGLADLCGRLFSQRQIA